MFNRSRLRVAGAMAFALSAVMLVGVAPASAEVVVIACNGDCGYYEVYDNDTGMPGAKCTYGNAYPYKLLNISVRPPQMHGNYPQNTKVEWRFRIQRKATPTSKWRPILISSYQSDLANDAIPANSFNRRTWTAPSNPSGWYRVVLELRWWYQGSVDGTAKVRYEWYNQVRANGGAQNVTSGYCIPNN